MFVEITFMVEFGAPYEAIIKEAEKLGLKVEREIDLLGVFVVGTIPDSMIWELKKIKGIHTVERSRSVQASKL